MTLLLLWLALLKLEAKAQGIIFTKGSWREILAKAKAQNKPIFVDFYAEWCGPCKMMAKNVFTDAEVGKYYNQHFISVQIDAEKQEPELVRLAQIEAYPSLYYFSPEGKVIDRNVGALDKKAFIALGKRVINKRALAKNLPAIKARYQANPNDSVEMRRYLLALAQAGVRDTSAIPVAQRYFSLLSEEELLEEENWHIVETFVASTSSPQFQYVLRNLKKFIDKFGRSAEEFVERQISGLMGEAIKEMNLAKVDSAKQIYFAVMAAVNPQPREKAFYDAILDMSYYEGVGDLPSYFNALIHWVETYNMDSREVVLEAALEIALHTKETMLLEIARNWSAKALQTNEDAIACYVHAFILENMGDVKNASLYAQKGLKLNPGKELKTRLEELLQRLK